MGAASADGGTDAPSLAGLAASSESHVVALLGWHELPPTAHGELV